MKRYFTVALSMCLVYAVNGQDLHFSQILQSPVLLNPGAVGVYDGWERVTLHHRTQWLGASTTFQSTGLAADLTLFKNNLRPKAHLGVGVSFFNDFGGDAKFGIQTGALTISGILPVGRSSQISLGIQTGFGSRKGDVSKLVYGSQWNGNNGYDQTINSGEAAQLNAFSYFDASTGLFYQFDGDKSTFARNNDVKFQIGGSVYHANAPTLKYRDGASEKLARKYVGMMNYKMDIPNTKFGFDAQFVQFIQGGHYETIMGGLIRRRFKEGTKQTGFSQDASVGIGAYFRLRDAIIPTAQIDFRGFRIGLSYDMTISALRNAYSGGSVEISLSYINLSNALFKRRRAPY